MRRNGVDDMGGLVLGIATDLLTFDFMESFTDAFEVANKCSEILMLRAGVEVCCVGELDISRIARFEAMRKA